jgi:predicted dehydrogenase
MHDPVRFGILGCAAVAEYALIAPAGEQAGIAIAAVASRDPRRGREYAERHGIAQVFSYEELLQAPDIEAIYVALPNSMHCEWSIRALEAEKHVLCEKPLASNAAEAEQMADAAARTGRKLVEAFHWRYHPLAQRLQDIVASGVLGPLQTVDVRFLIPAHYASDSDIRFNYALGGGSTMDAGCYCISLLRLLLGEPLCVTKAVPTMHSEKIDSAMQAELAFGGDCIGRFHCSHRHPSEDITMDCKIVGTRGLLTVLHPFTPHWGNAIELHVDGGTHREELPLISTYHYQAREFARVLREDTPIRTTAQDAVANMRVVDDVYRCAGLPLRGMVA